MKTLYCTLLGIITCTTISIAAASEVTYEISTHGRVQSGTRVFGNMRVVMRMTVSAADVDPSATSGAYIAPSATTPFFVRIDGESKTIVGDAGIVLQHYRDPVWPRYDIIYFIGQGASGYAQFLGRDFVLLQFFIGDRDPALDMLNSDALPTDGSFVGAASYVGNFFWLRPIPGDPEYGTSDVVGFTVCDLHHRDVCVPSEVKVRVLNPARSLDQAPE